MIKLGDLAKNFNQKYNLKQADDQNSIEQSKDNKKSVGKKETKTNQNSSSTSKSTVAASEDVLYYQGLYNKYLLTNSSKTTKSQTSSESGDKTETTTSKSLSLSSSSSVLSNLTSSLGSSLSNMSNLSSMFNSSGLPGLSSLFDSISSTSILGSLSSGSLFEGLSGLSSLDTSKLSSLTSSAKSSSLSVLSKIFNAPEATGSSILSSLFNGSTSSKVILSSGLSFLGFDTKNLDLSGISKVDFVGYFSKLIEKSAPDLLNTAIKTVASDVLSGNLTSIKDDLEIAIKSKLLGVDLTNAGESEEYDDIDAPEAWNTSMLVKDIKSKSIEEQQAILDAIVEQAPYLLNETYKENASSPDAIPSELMQTAKDCIAAAVYDNASVENYMNNEPWEVVQVNKNNESGYFSRVYVNNETNQVIVTNLATSTMEDIITDDASMMLGKLPDQYEDAVKNALDVLNDPQYEGYSVTITGLSLGGSLTELVASTKEVQEAASANNISLNAIALNGYGISNIVENYADGFTGQDGTQYHFMSEDEVNSSGLYSFITEDDLVSCSTKHYGKTILFQNDNSLIPHMVDNMAETLGVDISTEKPITIQKENGLSKLFEKSQKVASSIADLSTSVNSKIKNVLSSGLKRA
jgi:hypothetical protein